MKRRTDRLLNFTEKAIRGLAVSEQEPRLWRYDVKCDGLAVFVSPSGLRTFYNTKRRGKDSSRIKLGHWPKLSVEEARDEVARQNGQWSDDINPADKRRKERAAPTLTELFNDYIEQPTRGKSKRPRSAKTTKEYRKQFKTYIESQLGYWPITKITKKMVMDWFAKIKAPYMANRCLALVKAMLNYAVDSEKLDRNVASRISGNDEEKRSRHLSESEFAAFWKACSAEDSGDYWKVCWLTGQRQQEVLAMKWADLDLDVDKPIWRIPAIKGGKEGLAYISRVCADLLAKRKAESQSEYVFPRKSNPAKPMPVPVHAWTRIVKASGLSDLRPHDLRRTLATTQLDLGTGMELVGKSLNHSSLEATKIYARPIQDSVWDSVNKANEHIASLTK